MLTLFSTGERLFTSIHRTAFYTITKVSFLPVVADLELIVPKCQITKSTNNYVCDSPLKV